MGKLKKLKKYFQALNKKGRKEGYFMPRLLVPMCFIEGGWQAFCHNKEDMIPF